MLPIHDAGVADAGLRDGGVRADAGVPDAGDIDAGDIDADAGSVDAGTVVDGGGPHTEDPDAGQQPPGCQLARATFDFTCEGDEDVCDPLGDVEIPEQDMLATWSHYENDEFVVDIRFRAMPLTFPRIRWFFYVTPDPYNDAGPDEVGDEYHFPTGYSPEFLGGGLEFALGSSFDDPTFFPPSIGVPLPQSDLYDPCSTIFFAVDAPQMQVRLPLPPDSVTSYFMVTQRSIADALAPDFLFEGTEPSALSSLGGAPDTPADYRSICEITCADIQGANP